MLLSFVSNQCAYVLCNVSTVSPKVALQRPPQKKLNKGLQFDFDRAIIIYQTRPYSSAG